MQDLRLGPTAALQHTIPLLGRRNCSRISETPTSSPRAHRSPTTQQHCNVTPRQDEMTPKMEPQTPSRVAHQH